MSPQFRLALRLARREARRHPVRTMLVALLVAIPTTYLTVGDVILRTTTATPGARFARTYGTGDYAVRMAQAPTRSPHTDDTRILHTLEPLFPTGTRFLYATSALTVVAPRTDAPARRVTLRSIDLTDRRAHGIARLDSGRHARHTGEVTITGRLADDWSIRAGDTLHLRQPKLDLHVVGIVTLNDARDAVAILGPSIAADALRVAVYDVGLDGWLVADTPRTLSLAEMRAISGATTVLGTRGPSNFVTRTDGTVAWVSALRAVYELPADRWSEQFLGGWAVSLLMFVATGLTMSAAFTASARRHLETVGVLSANGASPKFVRLVLTLQGAIAGVVGAVVGMAASAVFLGFGRDTIEAWTNHSLGAYEFRTLDLVGVLVTVVVAATLSALQPARRAARMPVLVSLTRREPSVRSDRAPIAGLFVAVVGIGLLVVVGRWKTADSEWDGQFDRESAIAVYIAVQLILVAMIVFGIAIVNRAERLTRRAGRALRVAGRSLSRSRSRTSSAVAVIIFVAFYALPPAFTSLRSDVKQRTTADGASTSGSPIAANVAILDPPPTSHAVHPDIRQQFDTALAGATMTSMRVAATTTLTVSESEHRHLRTATLPAADDVTQHRLVAQIWADHRRPIVVDASVARLAHLTDHDRLLLRRFGAVVLPPPAGTHDGMYDWWGGRGTTRGGSDSVPVALTRTNDEEFTVSVGTGSPARRTYFARTLLVTDDFVRQHHIGTTVGPQVATRSQALSVSELDQLAAMDDEWTLSAIGEWTLGEFFPSTQGSPVPDGVGDHARAVTVRSTDPTAVEIFPRIVLADDGSSDFVPWLVSGVAIALFVNVLTIVLLLIGLGVAEHDDERRVFVALGATVPTIRRVAALQAALPACIGIAAALAGRYAIIVAGALAFRTPLRIDWRYGVLSFTIPVIVGAVAWIVVAVDQRRHPLTTARLAMD